MFAEIDHLVLPVESLRVARARLLQLGFQVEAEAKHPFGTSNACVFFSDGTYLEPLAVSDEAEAAAAIAAQNTFVARDRRFRLSSGGEGLSAIVLKSKDAERDHAYFLEHGIGGGPRLDFSREVIGGDGLVRTAAFRLAFADLGSEHFFGFVCERLNASALPSGLGTAHPNGVQGVSRLLTSGCTNQQSMYVLGRFFGTEPVATGSVFSFVLKNASIILRPAEPESGITADAIIFHVADLELTASLFDRAAAAYQRDGRRLIVLPAVGQGATLVFEEKEK
ncbi:VOC family protein [Rhizobium lemnae]|uniref:VOC family protein n=1 Tax=Rhizobium lemnae TaxID=1214924 RepID=A0ABV8E8X9_9HYPH|nr:VOC family protein [Rhizobium lemnae]MCJ8509034.1 VOC family protein [Rhizobium lemnae]